MQLKSLVGGLNSLASSDTENKDSREENKSLKQYVFCLIVLVTH